MNKKLIAFLASLVAIVLIVSPTIVIGQDINLLVKIPGGNNVKNFNEYIRLIYELVLTVAVMLAFLYIIWGGIEYINPLSSKQTAKERIIKAITGLLIVLGTYFLLNLINPDIFKIDLFKI